MKKLILIAVLMIFGLGFSQSNNPVLEVEGQLVKATYFHENGKVQQVGYFKEGKLDGTMKTYDRRGNLLQEAHYKDGLKHGKYIIYGKKGVIIKEMEFSEGMQVIEGQTGGSGTFTPGR